jgi:hypothetical protein
MRIDETLSGQAVEESKQSNGPRSAGCDEAFALLLQSEIAGRGEGTAPAGAVCESGSVPALWGTQSLIPNSAQVSDLSQAVSSLDGILTQLDSLKNALQQTGPPKAINALIEQINSQTAGLDDKMSGLPADHPLRDMAEELKVTAYMESLKWRRGDYL